VAVDLQYGPDGAVYFIDWYDQQHCHNPNTERWDRSNGRIYRMQWQATYKPAKVNLGAKSDVELVELLAHRNAWFGRTAQRLLHERATDVNRSAKGLDEAATARLSQLLKPGVGPTIQLRALWTASAAGVTNFQLSQDMLANEHVRAWRIQLAAEQPSLPGGMADELPRLARQDPSPVVRRYLASAIPRLPQSIAWDIATELAKHAEDRDDRNIPYLLWHGLAPMISGNVDRASLLQRSRACRN
jgi:hypothetical protein